MTEKQVQNSIKEYLQRRGHWVQTIQCGKIKQLYRNGKTRFIHLAEAGTPDLIACINGKFLGIEVKKNPKEVETWTRKITKWLQYPINNGMYNREVGQYKQHEKIRKAGGVVAVVGSLEELKNDLIKLKWDL